MKPIQEKKTGKGWTRIVRGIVISIFTAAAVSAAAGSARAQDPWRTVRIEVDEYRFDPARITLRAREPVRIELHNIGNEDHEFRSRLFDGPLIDVEGGGVTVSGIGIRSVLVNNGSTATIRWLAPEPGTYIFECRIPSHHGMDGVIVVEDGGAETTEKEKNQ